MLVPINTDAPVYHFPAATIGLIGTSLIAFIATGMGLPDAHSQWQHWILVYGAGLHPLQWVISNFVHFGFMHLLGNMVFLWGFGLVVEGKLGWQRFLLVFFAIAIAECAIEQTLMLGHEPVPAQTNSDELQAAGIEVADSFPRVDGSAGASSVVYGLLAISLVWAPKNEVEVFVMLLYRVFTFEITILTFAGWYIGIDLALTVPSGFTVATELLHTMGALIGFAVGVLFLKRGWVDCENWDLFAVISGNYGPWARDTRGELLKDTQPLSPQEEAAFQKAKQRRQKKSASRKADLQRRTEAIRQLLLAGEFQTAVEEYQALKSRHSLAHLPEDDLLKLIRGLLEIEQLLVLQPVVAEYVELYPDHHEIRLLEAQLALRIDGDRTRTRSLLKLIDRGALSPGQLQKWNSLMKRAQRI